MQDDRINNDNIVIDKEFKDMLPKLTDIEYRDLEKSILRDGCREPVAVWDEQGQMKLLGGHNRDSVPSILQI